MLSYLKGLRLRGDLPITDGVDRWSAWQAESLDIPHRWLSAQNIAANAPIVDLLKRIADRKKATAAQISLAWLLAQNPWLVPIPGTRKIDHLNENLGAINVELTQADLREIEAALSTITVHGGRMNEEQMKVVDQSA